MKEPDAVGELLEICELAQIRFTRLSSEVKLSGAASTADLSELPFEFRLIMAEDNKGFAVRARVQIDFSMATIDVEALAEYNLKESAHIPGHLAVQFMQTVAMNHIYPYLREGISMISAATRVPVDAIPMSPTFRRTPVSDQATGSSGWPQ